MLALAQSLRHATLPPTGRPLVFLGCRAGVDARLSKHLRANLQFGTATDLRVLNIGHAVSLTSTRLLWQRRPPAQTPRRTCWRRPGRLLGASAAPARDEHPHTHLLPLSARYLPAPQHHLACGTRHRYTHPPSRAAVTLSLQVQVEFSPPADSRASVVVLGDSVANLYDAANPNRLPFTRINLEPLQFHMHGGGAGRVATGVLRTLLEASTRQLGVEPDQPAACTCLCCSHL